MANRNVGDVCWFLGHLVEDDFTGGNIQFLDEGEIIAQEEMSSTIRTEDGSTFIALHENLYDTGEDALVSMLMEPDKEVH